MTAGSRKMKGVFRVEVVAGRHGSALVFVALLALSVPGAASADGWLDFWLTPDQQAERLFRQERYLEAAEVFNAPERKGVAYFRAGDFESAASVFGRISTPEAAFNRGNSLVMLGRYDEAILSYQAALRSRPDWQEAMENLALSRIRKERLAPPEDDAGGTGGELEADEIVFDATGRVDKSGTETEDEGGKGLSDDEMRAIWLRRVQNDPEEFLRTRFAYQLYRQQQAEQGDGDAPDR